MPTGSIQRNPMIPDDIKQVYLTAWDLDPIEIIDMAADRAPFIDQSQSLVLAVRRQSPALLVRRNITYLFSLTYKAY